MNSFKDVDREKARMALEKIRELDDLENAEEIKKKFLSHVKSIPMYIYSSGLIATLALIMSKANKDSTESKSYKFIKNIVVDYFNNDVCIHPFEGNDLFEIMNRVANIDEQKKYRLCTIDLLSYFQWLVKFAEGTIKGE